MELLIHSLSEFREIIFAIVEASAPKRLVEIGAESGSFTEKLVAWAKEHGAELLTVDPKPAEKVRALAEANPDAHRLMLEKSPAVLANVPSADVYVVDGDHNYAVVSRELAAFDRNAIVILHDVGWPCARRDFYYDPKDIPEGELHPHTFEEGVRLDDPGTLYSGFRGNGVFAVAKTEGGAKNGVLTAIDDFLAANPGYDFWVVPAVFGLGVLVPHGHPAREAIAAILRVYHQNPLIARLEENRLRNYLQVIALQDRIEILEKDGANERAQARATIEVLATEKAQKDKRIAELEARLAELESKPLVRAGAFLERALRRPPT